jgi:hypothetical protein
MASSNLSKNVCPSKLAKLLITLLLILLPSICVMYVTYTTAEGDPVLGIPVRIATMNGEGSFTDYVGPLFIQESAGKFFQYSGILPNTAAQDVATYLGPASATSTLFVATTPDGLRAQSTFASSTIMQ